MPLKERCLEAMKQLAELAKGDEDNEAAEEIIATVATGAHRWLREKLWEYYISLFEVLHLDDSVEEM